jgi:hypothetical protein
MRTREQQIAGNLKRGNCLRSGYGRKVVEEPLQRVAGGEVIQQVLDGHPGV